MSPEELSDLMASPEAQQGTELVAKIAPLCEGIPANIVMGSLFMMIHCIVESAPAEARQHFIEGVRLSCQQICGEVPHDTH